MGIQAAYLYLCSQSVDSLDHKKTALNGNISILWIYDYSELLKYLIRHYLDGLFLRTFLSAGGQEFFGYWFWD
jgi:hypothetical protein